MAEISDVVKRLDAITALLVFLCLNHRSDAHYATK